VNTLRISSPFYRPTNQIVGNAVTFSTVQLNVPKWIISLMECTDKFNTMSAMDLARGSFWQATGARNRGVAIKGGCYNGESCSQNILSKPSHATPSVQSAKLCTLRKTIGTANTASEMPEVSVFKLPIPWRLRQQVPSKRWGPHSSSHPLLEIYFPV
jgi:hypothetical protein